MAAITTRPSANLILPDRLLQKSGPIIVFNEANGQLTNVAQHIADKLDEKLSVLAEGTQPELVSASGLGGAIRMQHGASRSIANFKAASYRHKT